MSGYVLTYLTWPPLIVWALLGFAALLLRRPGSGCFLSVVTVIFAMLLMFGVMFPDCFPSATVTCPTDIDRNIMFYSIGLGTLVFNCLMWIRIGRRPASTAPEITEDREEPDFGQFMIYVVVAVAVIASIPLSFWLLGILSGMERH